MAKLPAWVLGIAASIALAGCSSQAGSVTGEVTYEGQPIKTGEINFVPVDGVGLPAAAEIKDGKFTASDIPPGKKQVQITEFVPSQGPISSADLAAQAGKKIETPPVMPAHAVGNGQEVEIKAGEQSLQFHLTKPAPG